MAWEEYKNDGPKFASEEDRKWFNAFAREYCKGEPGATIKMETNGNVTSIYLRK